MSRVLQNEHTEAVEKYHQARGQTTEQVIDILMVRRGYSEEQAAKEAQVGYLCQSILDCFMKLAKQNPKALNKLWDQDDVQEGEDSED